MARASASLLDNFWLRMASMFGHTWSSQYGTSPSSVGADTWAVALAGLTGQQVAAGLRATLVLGSDWPPSAPRFRALCFGIPEFPTVRTDLQSHHAQRQPFTVLTWRFLDAHRFRHASSDRADKLLREAYDEARAHVMAGGALPEPPAALITEQKPEFVPASPETVAAALVALNAMFTVPAAPPVAQETEAT